MYTIGENEDSWNDDIEPLPGEKINSARTSLISDSYSRDKRLSSSIGDSQRGPWGLSYFEASLHPDRPRFIKAVYDSQRPVRPKSEAARHNYRTIDPGKPNNDLIFGRTTRQLFMCCGYYMVMWSFLVGMTAALISIQIHTGIISIDTPRFTTKDSAFSEIGSRDYPHRHFYGNPGLAFRPLNYDDSNLIWFIPGTRHPETWAPLVGSLDAFLEHYSEPKMYGCSDCSKRPWPIDIENDPVLWDDGTLSKQYCCFYIKDLGRECTKQRGYGYVTGKPCILLKLNRIINWMPMLYENITDAPEEIHDRFDEKHIGVKCFGVHPADKEHIGEMAYYPPEGFPYYYFPYRNQKRFRSPLVFMQFLNATPGVLIMVECRAYAANIEIDGGSMMGSVRFEIMIDVSRERTSSGTSLHHRHQKQHQTTLVTSVLHRYRNNLLLLAAAFIAIVFRLS